MDPSGKKRAQPANFDSDAIPPSKRRQLSSDAAGADQQSATASVHPAAMAAAAAVPIAAPAVAAQPTSTDPAVSRASRLLPDERCHKDPLSVTLSFLDLADFAAAIRVCRHWQRTSKLRSAWPEFRVERLISGLIEDKDHWTQSRTSVSDVAAAFSSFWAPRLLALKCDNFDDTMLVWSHLHLLVNLRVLVLEGTIYAQALLPLHQLEYLQLHRVSSFGDDLLLAIRRLSVEHRLRHASLATMGSLALDLTILTIKLSGADGGLAPAALVSIRLRGNLSDASPSALLSLPSLTRLEWRGIAAAGTTVEGGQSLSPRSPLLQLHLNFDYDDGSGSSARLLQQTAIRATHLQELHITRPPQSLDLLVRPLRSLRLLDIEPSESSQLSQELLQSLATLPDFSELVVRQRFCRPQPFQLTVETLRCIADSRSWRLVRLVGHSARPQLTLPDDVDAQLAERLAHFRVQLEWTGAFQLARSDGKVVWKRTAI